MNKNRGLRIESLRAIDSGQKNERDRSVFSTQRRRVLKTKASDSVPSYTLPNNRIQYSPKEFVTPYNSLNQNKTVILDDWCNKKFIPVSRRQALKVVARFNKLSRVPHS